MTDRERWVAWVEPFGPANEPVYCKVPESTAIAVAKETAGRNQYTYESDEEALQDFMTIHWAWPAKPEPDPDIEGEDEARGIRMYLPRVWGFAGCDGWDGETPDDPVALYVVETINYEEEVIHKTSLESIVDHSIDGCLSTADKVDRESAPDLIAIRDGLLALAERITGCLPE